MFCFRIPTSIHCNPSCSTLVGQFSTPWNLLTAALTMAIVPVVVVYVRMQKQFVAGLTLGAVK